MLGASIGRTAHGGVSQICLDVNSMLGAFPPTVILIPRTPKYNHPGLLPSFPGLASTWFRVQARDKFLGSYFHGSQQFHDAFLFCFPGVLFWFCLKLQHAATSKLIHHAQKIRALRILRNTDVLQTCTAQLLPKRPFKPTSSTTP